MLIFWPRVDCARSLRLPPPTLRVVGIFRSRLRGKYLYPTITTTCECMAEDNREQSSKDSGGSSSLGVGDDFGATLLRALNSTYKSLLPDIQPPSSNLDQTPVGPIDVTSLRLELKEQELHDYDSEFAFYDDYKFSAKIPGLSRGGIPVELVSVHVRTIKRVMLDLGEFHDAMDSVSDGLLQFSTAVFDRFGRIKDSVKYSGSGVWGDEINDPECTMAYIEEIVVNEDYRGQGIGSWAVRAVLEREELAYCSWTFTWPSILNNNPFGPRDTAEVRSAKWARIVAFYRKLGFRRVGETFIFGYARDATHDSRRLPMKKDVEEKQQVRRGQRAGF